MVAIRKAKAELRQFMKTILDRKSPEEAKRQSDVVSKNIVNSKWFKDCQRISIYVCTTGEFHTDYLINKALELGKEVFIPQFTKNSTNLEMVRLPDKSSFDSLLSTLWGIRQPDPKWQWESYHLTGPLDLIFTPGVAFSITGLRCGHGKGYYDRFFASHHSIFPDKTLLKVGLALPEQIVETLPFTETDVILDCVVYPGQPIHFENVSV